MWQNLAILFPPMGKSTGQLVPVERDEKKLRMTALILTAFAIMGGIGIISAYARFAKNANREDRPSYVGELRHNLPVVRQDGQRSGLDTLQGKVWIVNSVSVTQPESCALSQSMVKAMEEKYRDNPDVAFVSMVIDPGAPETATKVLAEAAATQNASLPKWWFATTEPVILHKYLKDKFKLGTLPHQVEGKWDYDTSLVLVDRQMKLRKAVVPQQRGGAPFVTGFDFDKAAQWDAQGIKTGTERSNVEEMILLLEKTIDILLNEKVNASEP